MPQQPGDRIPKAWTEDAILALVEPRIRTLIRKIGDIGGSPVDHGALGGLADDDHVQYALTDKSRPSPWVAAADLAARSIADLGTRDHDLLTGLADDDHVQYLIDLPATGGDGITVATRTIAVNLTDNTIMAKVGAAAAGPLSMALNTVLVRSGGDIVALSMPQVSGVSGSIMVRDAQTPTPDIRALVMPINSIIQTDSAGNWQSKNFPANSNVVSDAVGALTVSALGANRWVITDSLGRLDEVIAITDWMLVGVANAPNFLIAAANGLVGKFGTAATAFNVVAANTLVGRLASGTDLNDLAVAAQQLMLRGSGDMAATTIPDSNFVGRPVSGNLGAVTPAQSRVMLALKYISFLDPPGLHVGTTLLQTSLVNDRTYFHYIGKAGGAITTCEIVTEVATAFVVGGLGAAAWAQVGIFTGAFSPSVVTVARRGFTDVASTFNSTGRKVTTVALTGVSEGDDLWVAFGSDGDTNFELRALIPDVIRSGVVRRAFSFGDLDELPTPVTASLETSTFAPAWIGVAI